MATEKRLIDADALIKDWNELTKRMVRDADGKIPVDFGLVIRELSKTPTVDAVEVVHGRWEQDGIYNRCSVCHKITMMPHLKGLARFNFCPYCGAKMDGDVNV